MSLVGSGAVTVAGYQGHTGDTSSSATAVSAALIEGQSLVEEHLRRLLEHTERTDSFRIYPGPGSSRVYPDAYPITDSALTIDGRALLGAEPDESPFVGVFETSVPNVATVTWTGGYTAATLPVTLAHAIYEVAHKLATDTSSSSAEVESVSLGDASVNFRDLAHANAIDSLVPGLSARIAPYRNRRGA